MSPALIGTLLGAFVITGLISRVVDKYAFKAHRGAKKALLVAFVTTAICLVVGGLGMGVRAAALNYVPLIAVWFAIDLLRARRAQGQAAPTK